jgi:ureidoacrylate peracid hydrolase
MTNNGNQKLVTLPARPENIEIDLKRTAVAVVDMQNAFCSKKGMFDVAGMFDEEKVKHVIAANKTVIEAARSAGVKVIYIRMGFRPDFSNAGGVESPTYWKEVGMVLMRSNPEWMGKFVTVGTWDWQIVDDLAPQDGDIIINKHRYSGFVGTELNAVLHTLNIKHLVLTGIATNVCVEATLRDAFSHEYFPILIEDACGNAGPGFTQEATVWNVENLFGWVAGSDDFQRAVSSK